MQPLSGRQLSERFPMASGCGECSRVTWLKILRLWRDAGKLRQRDHYMQGLLEGENVRLYSVPRVVRLVVQENNGDKPRRIIQYLYEQYVEQFVEILEEDHRDRINACNGPQATPTP